MGNGDTKASVRGTHNRHPKQKRSSKRQRETLINSCPPYEPPFGEKPHDTTGIPAFFACVRRKIHRLIRRTELISVSRTKNDGFLIGIYRLAGVRRVFSNADSRLEIQPAIIMK
jgi:hypothetical protein